MLTLLSSVLVFQFFKYIVKKFDGIPETDFGMDWTWKVWGAGLGDIHLHRDVYNRLSCAQQRQLSGARDAVSLVSLCVVRKIRSRTLRVRSRAVLENERRKKNFISLLKVIVVCSECVTVFFFFFVALQRCVIRFSIPIVRLFSPNNFFFFQYSANSITVYSFSSVQINTYHSFIFLHAQLSLCW